MPFHVNSLPMPPCKIWISALNLNTAQPGGDGIHSSQIQTWPLLPNTPCSSFKALIYLTMDQQRLKTMRPWQQICLVLCILNNPHRHVIIHEKSPLHSSATSVFSCHCLFPKAVFMPYLFMCWASCNGRWQVQGQCLIKQSDVISKETTATAQGHALCQDKPVTIQIPWSLAYVVYLCWFLSLYSVLTQLKLFLSILNVMILQINISICIFSSTAEHICNPFSPRTELRWDVICW